MIEQGRSDSVEPWDETVPASRIGSIIVLFAGQTEMNVYLGHNAFGSEGFQDPLM